MILAVLGISVIALFSGYIKYELNNILEADKLLYPKNDKYCKIIKGAIGIEDIVPFDHFLIGTSNDNMKLWILQEYLLKTPNGAIVSIDVSEDIKEQKIVKLNIQGFPVDIALHPQGMYIYKQKFLYVINHAYDRGGERIEVIEVKKNENDEVALKYLRSIILPDSFVGILDDLVVIDEDEFYVTTWRASPDNKFTGRKRSCLRRMLLKLRMALHIKHTFVYHCMGPICTKVPNTSSLMNNGIAYDLEDKIYVVNLPERKVRKYRINPYDHTELLHVRDIEVGFCLDNIEYDPKTKLIYAGILGRLRNYLDVIDGTLSHSLGKYDIWGGSLVIDTQNDDKYDVMTMTKNKLEGISSVYMIDRYIYHSSWFQEGVMVCMIP